ncbi:Capsular polysaccharide ABC transporter, ATP-binding protein KpsT [Candidatus Burkholderia verschuerenii]|uniref:Capsular polysaccharide ABC transporter, ATP-binding protein KpsT n=1 Tax=Candidatus Burkholderia verschuerenii TaxID=242163 RepID=A0A0L0M423_9BURK|nr:ATPase [Candidatus Burkholderia verschuerenii]KND57103.1 Capsular polysaccharide ABC transporter, ATP-binding protein KpsT [Candidatus Burkholderia verschuerenii]
MIHLHHVSDTPRLSGSRFPLLSGATLDIPRGRYALLSRAPELHRPVIDALAGLRRPGEGFVQHRGRVSWPLGRQGFIRGKANGLRMIEFVCALHGLDASACIDLVSDLITTPAHLNAPMEHWPLHTRQEVSFALALAPDFDVYIIDGAMPFEPCRFTRLWLALFEERVVGRTLILSTYRQQQLADYCNKGLVYERSTLRINDDLDACIRRFPPRRAHTDAIDAGHDIAADSFDGNSVEF